VGLDGTLPPGLEAGPMPGMSEAAERVYRLLGKEARPMEELEDGAALDPGAAVSALCELELLGLAVQLPGRRYQRV